MTALLCVSYLTLVPDSLTARDRFRKSVSVDLLPPTPFKHEEAAQLRADAAALPTDASHIFARTEIPTGAGHDARSTHPADLVRVKFDLSDPYSWAGEGGSAIDMRKELRVNGVDIGPAAIRVSEDSTLSIARDKLNEILVRLGRNDVARRLGGPRSGGFVSFEEIRRRGVEVRYDAPSDRVVLAI
ncbi:hypothetical protein SAMN05428974_3834 [Sphingopyxis sp. YR583]|uniref:hypothetical protein n=1 Tax=Sphingopyxis sp. YR583 TaxID=1881047 RepID=UPI0008A74D35|nr:hypothetical protein [Sphingopyxis sp. YR583]SEH20088.1 hypothetical protein SAMN05428974_3834 [Sphingopyxis sp. YR583]